MPTPFLPRATGRTSPALTGANRCLRATRPHEQVLNRPNRGMSPIFLGRNYSNVHADAHKLIRHGLVDKQPDGRVWVPWADVVVKRDASLLSAA